MNEILVSLYTILSYSLFVVNLETISNYTLIFLLYTYNCSNLDYQLCSNNKITYKICIYTYVNNFSRTIYSNWHQ